MNNEILLTVRHEKQKSDWDCGVTCLRMLIDFYQRDLEEFDRLVQSYECNNSTWTIDLLHLLKQSQIKASFHTITIGCSPDYETMAYYQTLINRDRQRVDLLFHRYADAVELKSHSSEDIREHLRIYRRPCVVLIDANKLKCSDCNRNTLEHIFGQIVSWVSPQSYQGHYIVVVGYTSVNNQHWFRYVDPGQNDQICTTTEINFDQARKSRGTDEDIIFCYE